MTRWCSARRSMTGRSGHGRLHQGTRSAGPDPHVAKASCPEPAATAPWSKFSIRQDCPLRTRRPLRRIERVFASDPAELVRNGLAALANEDRRWWSGAARTERLLELRALQERLDAEMIRCVAGWDAAAAWAEDPALGPKSWLASRARMTRPEADRLVASARLVQQHDATAAALAAGEVSPSQVQALARAAHQRADAYAEHEPTLLEAARVVE